MSPVSHERNLLMSHERQQAENEKNLGEIFDQPELVRAAEKRLAALKERDGEVREEPVEAKPARARQAKR